MDHIKKTKTLPLHPKLDALKKLAFMLSYINQWPVHFHLVLLLEWTVINRLLAANVQKYTHLASKYS